MTRNKLILLVFSLLFTTSIYSQKLNWDWIQLWKASIHSIDIDNNKNIYVLCSVHDTLNLLDTTLIGGSNKGYLIKIDSNKNFVLATLIDTL